MVKIQSFFKKNQLALFFLIAFGYTWIFQLMIGVLAPERGQDLVLFIPSIYGPTLAALLVPLLTDGIHGLAEFLKTRLTWKVNLLWYLIAILFIPTLLLVLRGVHLLIFPEISLGSLSIDRSLLQVISGFLMMLTFGPLAEELGWRGFAIPKLQEKMNALIASVVFGVIWWAWHLPQLLTPALQWSVGGMPVFIYLLTILPGSILATWIVNNSRGSVLPVILFHASMNFFMGLLGFESPYAFQLILAGLWAAAILVVFVSGPNLRVGKDQAANQSKEKFSSPNSLIFGGKMEKKARIQSMGVAMSLGLVLGGLVGIFIDQMVVFAGGGMVLGLAVGLAIEKKRMAS